MNNLRVVTIIVCCLFSITGLRLAAGDETIFNTSPPQTRTMPAKISINNNHFVVNGRRIWINGTNTPWHSWNDFGHGFDAEWWSNHFKILHENNVNCTNVWISCDGNNASPGIDKDGFISSPTDKFWSDVDKLFELAKTNKIYLMITLITFNHSKPGSPNSKSWQKMYKHPVNREAFVKEYVIPFVQRHKDNPYFFSIKIGEELEWVWEVHGVKKKNVLDLVARVANAVHATSDVLVCNGFGSGPKYNSQRFAGNLLSDESLGKLQHGAYIDFYNIHFYDWQNKWFGNPFDKSPSDWGVAGKPCLVGEYPARGTSSYGPLQCLQRAFAHGWQGVMVWTSNGVDASGSLANFKDAFSVFRATHNNSVFPLSYE